MTKRILSLCCAVCLTTAFGACSNTSEITETSAASYENSTTMPQLDENESETETKTEASVTEATEQSDEPIETKSNDEYEYWVYDDHISICEYLGSDSEVIVPAEIDGLPVTVLEEYAFGGIDTLTRVELPDSLITIGDSAFGFCKNLKSVVIPENVSEIGEDAFIYCYGLKKADFAYGVTEIGSGMFAYCENLEEVTIPDTVKTIGDHAFSDCTSLEKIEIPESVTSLGFRTFYYCENLSGVSLPDSFDEFAIEQAFKDSLWYEENFGTAE